MKLQHLHIERGKSALAPSRPRPEAYRAGDNGYMVPESAIYYGQVFAVCLHQHDGAQPSTTECR
jgi:hypothetical protein